MAGGKNTLFTTFALFLAIALVARCDGELVQDFYNGKCGNASVEQVVFEIVKHKVDTTIGLVADLIRLTFHDCFVRGCDASILLDGVNSEKNATENLQLEAFEHIDDIKMEVEAICPGVVSCADILVLATRDTMFLNNGKWFDVETGRRDGLVSSVDEALIIPGENALVTDAIRKFAKIGLSVYDLVVLLGSHTLGIARCNHFQDRLYNFNNTGKPDPTLDPSIVEELTSACPADQDPTETFAFMDPETPGILDTKFYEHILDNKAILKFDQRIAFDPRTRGFVMELAHDPFYNDKLAEAMIKMTRIGVLTGNEGEVRKSCRLVN